MTCTSSPAFSPLTCVEDAVERIARDVEGHRIRARIEVHLVQVLKVIQIGEDAAGSGVVLQIVEHPVDLIELPFLVDRLLGELIAVRFADRARFIRPAVPDMRVEVADVVALLLPDP